MLADFRAFRIAKEFYWLCRTQRVPPFIHSQLVRASSAIALNLAEGSGRATPNDQRHFYTIALGSLRECEAIIELENLSEPVLREKLDALGCIVYALAHKNRSKLIQAPATKSDPHAKR